MDVLTFLQVRMVPFFVNHNTGGGGGSFGMNALIGIWVGFNAFIFLCMLLWYIYTALAQRKYSIKRVFISDYGDPTIGTISFASINGFFVLLTIVIFSITKFS